MNEIRKGIKPRWFKDWHRTLMARIVKLFSILILFWVLAASAIVFFESKEEKSSIKEYHHALWYTLVTISTVGYGDHYPITTGGKIVGGVIIVFSFGFAGFIVSRIQETVVNNAKRKAMGLNGSNFSDHYVIIGWNPFSKVAAYELLSAGKKVAILAEHERNIGEIETSLEQYKSSLFKTFGMLENTEVYDRLCLESAIAALIICEDDSKTMITALQLKAKNEHLEVIAHIQNQLLKETVHQAGVTFAVSSNEIVGRLLASFAFEPDVSHFMEDLLSTSKEVKDFDMQEYLVTAKSNLVGMNYGDVYSLIRKRNGGVLVGLSGTDEKDRKKGFQPGPKDDTKINVGHYLIVIVDKPQAEIVKDLTGAKEQGRRP